MTPGWRFVSIGFEGDPVDVGGGVNPWRWPSHWVGTGEHITVAHPSYPRQRHSMAVYVLEGAVPPVRFAAGELSNGVWGFFVPEPDRG